MGCTPPHRYVQALLLESFAAERRSKGAVVMDRAVVRHVLTMLMELGINSQQVRARRGIGATLSAALRLD